MPWNSTSESPETTQAIAAAIGARLAGGDVLALIGEMGAGKTTLVRGLLRGLEGDEEQVSSPTYTLMHEYAGRLPLRHFDAWMEEREEAFLVGGGAEWLSTESGVAVIEWAGRVAEHLPEQHLELELRPLDALRRELRLTPIGHGGRRERWQALLGELHGRFGGELLAEEKPDGHEPEADPGVARSS